MIVVLDEALAVAELERGELQCSCGGRLRPWGHSAPWAIRHRGGGESRRRWRRGRCQDFGATHVVVAGVLPRRRDALSSVGTALVEAADGIGHRRIAERLALPAATVRSWLRGVRAGAAWLQATAMSWAHQLDRDLGRVQPMSSPLADAVSALAIAAAAAPRCLGVTADPWHVIASMTHGRLLSAPSD